MSNTWFLRQRMWAVFARPPPSIKQYYERYNSPWPHTYSLINFILLKKAYNLFFQLYCLDILKIWRLKGEGGIRLYILKKALINLRSKMKIFCRIWPAWVMNLLIVSHWHVSHCQRVRIQRGFTQYKSSVTRIPDPDVIARHQKQHYSKKKFNIQQPVPSQNYRENAVRNAKNGIFKKTALFTF